MKRNTFESLLLTGLLAMLLLLSGCALMDSILGAEEQAVTNDAGQQLYETPQGDETTDPVDPVTGIANKPITRRVVTGGNANWAAGLLNLLGPWGALAGAVMTAGTGIYASARNKQRKVSDQKAAAAREAAAFLSRMVESIKEGDAVDADKNGKIDVDEIKDWVRRQGGKFADPEYLRKLVNEATA